MMKTFARFAMLPALAFSPVAHAQASTVELERRCAEQERQIRQLEVQVERLQSQLDDQEMEATETAKNGGYSKDAAASTKPGEQPNESPAGPTHIVRSGESLSQIAKLHGTSTVTLAKLNAITNPAKIREGQSLKLPTASGNKAADQGVMSTHRVKAGETLYSIARKHGLSMEVLAAANPKIDPRTLRVGQELHLASQKASGPGPSDNTPSLPKATKEGILAPTPGRTIMNQPVVRRIRIDDPISFGDFAKQHGMAPEKLNALNGLQLEPKTPLASGSELYVSAQPLE